MKTVMTPPARAAELGYTGMGAAYSDDERHRLWLSRSWAEPAGKALRYVAFVGLNPSTANHEQDDATIRRDVAFAKSWGAGGLVKVNLFSLRATEPRVMLADPRPVHVDNDEVLMSFCRTAWRVVACWGNHGEHLNRAATVRTALRLVCDLHYLRLTKTGQPGHTLYLPATLEPILWRDE